MTLNYFPETDSLCIALSEQRPSEGRSPASRSEQAARQSGDRRGLTIAAVVHPRVRHHTGANVNGRPFSAVTAAPSPANPDPRAALNPAVRPCSAACAPTTDAAQAELGPVSPRGVSAVAAERDGSLQGARSTPDVLVGLRRMEIDRPASTAADRSPALNRLGRPRAAAPGVAVPREADHRAGRELTDSARPQVARRRSCSVRTSAAGSSAAQPLAACFAEAPARALRCRELPVLARASLPGCVSLHRPAPSLGLGSQRV